MQILQLEKRLQEQFDVRVALEKALGYRTSVHHNTNDVSMPKVIPLHPYFMEYTLFPLSIYQIFS